MRSGHSPKPQLYHLREDPSESRNLATERAEKTAELAARLDAITGKNIAPSTPHDFE
jgi:hypothetical protein